MKVETYVTDGNRIAVYAMLWRQERFMTQKPEATAFYLDDFDGSNFENLISREYSDKLVSFKESYLDQLKSII